MTYKHGGPDIELFLVLSNEDVHRHNILQIVLLHLTDDVRHPLELLLRPRHPNEVHLIEEIKGQSNESWAILRVKICFLKR